MKLLVILTRGHLKTYKDVCLAEEISPKFLEKYQ